MGIKESAQNRIPEGIKNFAVEQKLIPQEVVRQEGSGNRKRKKNRKSKSKGKKNKKRKKNRDIFS